MAAAFRKFSQSRIISHFLLKRPLTTIVKSAKHTTYIRAACGCIAGTTIACYIVKCNLVSSVSASKGDDQRSSEKRAVLQTQRELRFLSFASVEHEGNVYMTPEDFLESVTEEAPRPRSGRRHISREEMERFFRATPGKKRGSTQLFRNLHDKGLISYTEYLFLLCVLTKPKSGFKIAFNMFDTDGNQRVDKNEFLVLMDVYENRFGYSSIRQTENVQQPPKPSIASNIWSRVQELVTSYEGIMAGGNTKDSGIDDDGKAAIVDTTLTVHFFGRKGNDTLKYEDFHRFMDNLQTEVLELEFGEFSRGMRTITELEFAKILLRYTILTADEHEEYLTRLRKKVQTFKGITFKEFKDFCQFLNNLDDFALAMRMYTYANHPISQGDFKRAVVACTGQMLSDHLVDVVYKLFDKDDDNHLSHKEFISVMKDRLHRGFRNYPLHQNNWETFKSCVKNQMKAT